MWDVKELAKRLRKRIEKMFYLNYVGCKVLKAKCLSIPLPLFYLNYVGCKDFVKVLDWQEEYGFI